MHLFTPEEIRGLLRAAGLPDEKVLMLRPDWPQAKGVEPASVEAGKGARNAS